MTQSDTKIINHSITRFLARREHSYQELLQKLSKKGFCPEKCTQQMNQFVERGLQSNQRFVESFVRNAYLNGKGPQFIRNSMHAHDINESDANIQIENEDYDWFTLAQKVREKKFGENKPTDFVLKQKQMRFLQYRGFEQEQIKYAVSGD